MQAAGTINVEALEVAEIFWQFDRPFLVDASAFENHVGPLTLTPRAEAVADTVTRCRYQASNRRG
ncbi:MAG: hypothetical protein M3071_15735 [Actinomycetota bacterium]|nr:hypothetical protein [Actinomycetota bacterium]